MDTAAGQQSRREARNSSYCEGVKVHGDRSATVTAQSGSTDRERPETERPLSAAPIESSIGRRCRCCCRRCCCRCCERKYTAAANSSGKVRSSHCVRVNWRANCVYALDPLYCALVARGDADREIILLSAWRCMMSGESSRPSVLLPAHSIIIRSEVLSGRSVCRKGAQ